MERTTPNRIPFWFNLLLTLAFFGELLAFALFHRKDITKRDPLIETLPYIRDHKIAQLLVGIAAIIIAIALFVWILRAVWNRVIAKLVTVPQITFSEAYALSFLFFRDHIMGHTLTKRWRQPLTGEKIST